MPLVAALARLIATRFRWFFATGDQRDAEILALRHQILVLERQVNRPRFDDVDRSILATLAGVLDRRRLTDVFLIVKPATVIGWHRRLVFRHWTQPPTAKPRRPPIDPELRRLIVRLAGENPTWGYRRVHGELCRLGHRVAASTVWKVLRAAGVDPTRDRTGPSWSKFIRTQAKAIVATDFVCVDTALLRRFHVLFVIEIATRRVHLAGIATNPDGAWTTQAARNLLMAWNERLRFRLLIRDRAGQFTRSFDDVFAGSGITGLKIPPRAPQANAFAERWVRTLRHELLDRTIIWNRRHLETLLADCVEHYNTHRPHRGLHQRAPDDETSSSRCGPDTPSDDTPSAAASSTSTTQPSDTQHGRRAPRPPQRRRAPKVATRPKTPTTAPAPGRLTSSRHPQVRACRGRSRPSRTRRFVAYLGSTPRDPRDAPLEVRTEHSEAADTGARGSAGDRRCNQRGRPLPHHD